MARTHRRQNLGEAASAALPVLWGIIAKLEWNHRRLALELEEPTGKISKLMYGDRKPGRQLSDKLRALGVAVDLWDQPLPRGWLPHPKQTRRAA